MLTKNACVNEYEVFTEINDLIFDRLSADESVVDFWQKHKFVSPELYKIAQVVLAVPATQVSVERAFSALNCVLTEKRTKLNERTLKNIMLVKTNKTLFKSASLKY